ncbi:MAG: alpha/beta hydrolase [Candidatus Bathyarchaeota archaeon]|uniref:alpha/beta fold hydrolase n=1 Tax=Candidatus Bathycorpusculum sp. TaxID=2994959 RepID=UPI00281AC8EE|nr:alpha/beta hydrolase [Candidatus Termiticorpusculum sp.]MCL2257126.1 alpha/beta hydrolase [Candidatus Termiticorpusculum sp.]MCL2292727.1 alpha/beta hydrolase [Candidatus Termiticorpusculum sp.]
MEKKLNLNGYKCSTLVNKVPGIPIVFLHGLGNNIEIWQRIGVADLLDAKRVPYLALDMPYGEKSVCKPKTRDIEKNVTFTYDAIEHIFGGPIPPVLVGASIGGNMALHFASRFPTKGLVLIGPAHALDENLIQTYTHFNFPSTIIWGSEDDMIASEDMRTLACKIANSKLVIYKDAKHSAYRDNPEQFKRDLLELYIKAEN